MQVICVDNEFKPNEIPESRWLEWGKVYKIEKAYMFTLQSNLLGVKLEGIDNRDLAPYSYFDIRRFQPTEETINKAIINGSSIPLDEDHGQLSLETTIMNNGCLAI